MNDSHINNKLVSVIIPTYNTEKYISDAINSVIKQDYSYWELIIIDDGSTDNTASIVSGFLSDQRITYLKIKNAGVSNARNLGAKLAKGDYFCFLDADDFFYPKNLLEKVNLLNTQPTVGMVHSDIEMTNEFGQPTGEINSGISGNNLHLDLLAWNRCVVPAPSSIMVRKEVFYAAGTWDTYLSTAADQDFFIQVGSRYKIERIDKILTGYRIVNASMSRNAAVFEKDHLAVFYKAKKNGMFPTKDFEKKCFANLHLIIAASWWTPNKKMLQTLKYLFLAFMYSPSIVLNKLKSKLLKK